MLHFILTLLITLTLVIWAIGGIGAIISMWIIDEYNKSVYPYYTPYTRKEFIIGFIGSWYTTYIIIDGWIEDTF